MTGSRTSAAAGELARIALGARSQSRFFIIALAKKLKKRYGSEIHIYCGSAQEVTFYEVQNGEGTFASVNEARSEYGSLFDTGLVEADVFSRARSYEEMIGVTINRLIVPDRHLGRGYSLGGFFHPRSRYSEESNYVQAVHAICERLAYWEHEFSARDITLCINGSREAAWIARTVGVPYRAMARSRIRNLHFWSANEMYETPAFEQAWKGTELFPSVSLEQPYHSHLASRAKYQKAFSIGTLVKGATRTCLQQVYWRLKGYQKAQGYYLSENLKLQWRMWRDGRRLARKARTQLGDLADKPFVYFPLHVEPETALHGLSPEYFYQHALIAAVSRDLPAGVLLAVKEAYGVIGRRPENFYDQILDLKNVILLDTWEMGLACAQSARAVVTICGTAGLEAVAAGTPVIAFGKHNLYNFLPSVRVVNDERELPVFLSERNFWASIPRCGQGRRAKAPLGYCGPFLRYAGLRLHQC